MQIHKWASRLLESPGGDQQFLVMPKDFHILNFQMFKVWSRIFIVVMVVLFRQNEREQREGLE